LPYHIVCAVSQLFERLIAHRFFKRKLRMPWMAAHMRQQEHRKRYAEDILTLNAGAEGAKVREMPRDGRSIEETTAASPEDGVGHTIADGSYLMPVALQLGDRGPEVDNLNNDPAAIYHAVRCGFARAYELLDTTPQGDSRRDGWQVALEVFPDSILERIQAEHACETQSPEPN
jgi:hypothetical protein